jgi:transposase
MATRRCVGIDVSARDFTVAIEGRAEQLVFSNDAAGHEQWVRMLRRRGARARACLEATGIYHLDLALALHRATGVESMVGNPMAARDFGRELLQRSKTDGVDADVLLAYARRMRFEPWRPPASEILDLPAIVRRIGALTLTRTRERNRLHAAGRRAELTGAITWDIEAHLEHLAQSIERVQARATSSREPRCTSRRASARRATGTCAPRSTCQRWLRSARNPTSTPSTACGAATPLSREREVLWGMSA